METQTATPIPMEPVLFPKCMPIQQQQQSSSINDYFKEEPFLTRFRHNMGNINQSINYFNDVFEKLPKKLSDDPLSLGIIKNYNHLLRSIYDSIKFLLVDSKNKKDEFLSYISYYQNVEYNLNIQITSLNQQIEFLNKEIMKRDQSILFLERTIDKKE